VHDGLRVEVGGEGGQEGEGEEGEKEETWEGGRKRWEDRSVSKLGFSCRK